MNSSRLSFSLLLALGLSSPALAQTPRPQFGVKGGATISSYVGNTVSGMRPVWGGLAGVTLNAPLTRDATFSIQPELLYSQQGYKQNDGNRTAAIQRLHYLTLPVLARVNAGGLIFEAGPQAGLLLTANGYRKLTDGGKDKFTNTSAYNRFDVGYAAGVGYQGGSGIGGGVRYYGGLTSVAPDSKLRNSVFQLYASYAFVK